MTSYQLEVKKAEQQSFDTISDDEGNVKVSISDWVSNKSGSFSNKMNIFTQNLLLNKYFHDLINLSKLFNVIV